MKTETKQKAKEITRETAQDWPQWTILAFLGIEQAITNFNFLEPLFGGYGKYALGLLWASRIGFVIYRAYKKPAN